MTKSSRAIRNVCGVLLLLWGAAAHAQSRNSFYAGKTISIVVPFAAGGIYDTGARLLSRHMVRHIAGSPSIIVQNQPSGGGGIDLANRLGTITGDGTLIATLPRGLPQFAMTGDPSIRFDPLKLTWLGSLSAYADDAYLLALNSTHPVKTAEQLRTGMPSVRIGAISAGSTNLTLALVARETLGFKYDIVRGYPGASAINLAQQRNEVDGQFGDVSFFATNMRDLWEAGKLVALVQFGRRTRLPTLGDTPMARELTDNPDDLALLEFAEMPFFMALPIAAPAAIPAERAKILRAAFIAAARDPALLQDAKKMNFAVDPISGEEVLAVVQRASRTPKAVIERYKLIIAQ